MSDVPTRIQGPVKAGWITLGVAWLCFLVPIPGLGILGWVLNLVAFIVAIVVITKGSSGIGILQVVLTVVASPIMYFIGLAVFAGTIAASGAGIASTGAKAIQAANESTKSVIVEVLHSNPNAREAFGEISDTTMDFQEMMEAGNAGNSVVAFTIIGDKGEGRLIVEKDPATQAFKSATLTLPSGETVEVDAATLKQLQSLQP